MVTWDASNTQWYQQPRLYARRALTARERVRPCQVGRPQHDTRHTHAACPVHMHEQWALDHARAVSRLGC
jgi:hypothetical protein